MDEIEILAVTVTRKPGKDRVFAETIYYRYNGYDSVTRGSRIIGWACTTDNVDEYATDYAIDRAKYIVGKILNVKN